MSSSLMNLNPNGWQVYLYLQFMLLYCYSGMDSDEKFVEKIMLFLGVCLFLKLVNYTVL